MKQLFQVLFLLTGLPYPLLPSNNVWAPFYNNNKHKQANVAKKMLFFWAWQIQ